MDKADFTLYLGGTSSGKSMKAEEQVNQQAEGPVLYAATARKSDDPAMCERIRRHRLRRPDTWLTLECPRHPAAAISKAVNALPAEALSQTPTILLDCVTLWVTNILLDQPEPLDFAGFLDAVRREAEELLAVMKSSSWRWILVSGEVGLGGIAQDALSRAFADGLGMANQLLAKEADRAFLVVAGRLLPLA